MRISLISLLILPLLAGSCSSCTRSEGKTAAEAAPQHFELSATMQRELQLAPVTLEPVRDELNLTGVISSDEDKTVKVSPLAGGVVEDLTVELGDYVKQGQVLAVIRSGEAVELATAGSQAAAALTAVARNYTATEDMYHAGLAAERDLVSARQELVRAQNEVAKNRKQLSLYRIDGDGRYRVTAPISGFIIDKNVSNGSQFRAESVGNLFTIADLREVWILANVFESDISKVRVGYAMAVRTLAYPDRVFRGQIDKVFNVLDPDSKVMKVRVRLANPDYALKPQMYAQITMTNTEPGPPMLAVPSQALIFDKNRHFVLVYHSPTRIDTREVRVARTVGDVTYLAGESVAAGEQVIVRNQLLIYDQIND